MVWSAGIKAVRLKLWVPLWGLRMEEVRMRTISWACDAARGDDAAQGDDAIVAGRRQYGVVGELRKLSWS